MKEIYSQALLKFALGGFCAFAVLIGSGMHLQAASSDLAPSNSTPSNSAQFNSALSGTASGRTPAGIRKIDPLEGDTGTTALIVPFKSESEMNLTELREEQSFVYAEGGRDPMTYQTVRKEQEPPTLQADDSADRGAQMVVEVDQDKLSAYDQEKMMQTAWKTTETYFTSGNYAAAIKEVDRVDGIASKWHLPWSSMKAREQYERLLGLRETARRVSLKQSIMKEFESLPVSVEAVEESRHGAAAVINDRIMEVGERLVVGSGAELVIDSIDEDSVVFEYKGQKLRRHVGEEVDSTGETNKKTVGKKGGK